MPVLRRSAWSAWILVAALALMTVVWRGGSTAGAVTPTTYTRTFAWTDFKTLDYRLFPQAIPVNPDSGSSGGVYLVHDPDSTDPGPLGDQHFEKTVDLPVGAKVTEVTFYYRACNTHESFGAFSFGSYRPAAGSKVLYLPEVPGPVFGNCPTVNTFTRTGDPITTVVANRRYTLWVLSGVLSYGTQSSPFSLLGARLRYTCAGDCF